MVMGKVSVRDPMSPTPRQPRQHNPNGETAPSGEQWGNNICNLNEYIHQVAHYFCLEQSVEKAPEFVGSAQTYVTHFL